VWEDLPKCLSPILGLRQNLTELAHYLHQAIVLNDFFVREPRSISHLDQINRRLKAIRLPCLLTAMLPNELRQRFKLGGIFPIYRLRDDWGQEYSVVFGEQALLLDSLLFFWKTKDDRAMML